MCNQCEHPAAGADAGLGPCKPVPPASMAAASGSLCWLGSPLVSVAQVVLWPRQARRGGVLALPWRPLGGWRNLGAQSSRQGPAREVTQAVGSQGWALVEKSSPCGLLPCS